MPAKKAKKSTKKAKTKKAPAKKTAKKAKKKSKKKAEKWTWFDFLRTPVLASVGAFSAAEEGIENLVRELVERGEASEKEGKKIVEDFRKRTRTNRKDMEKRIDERIEKTLKSLRLPTKKDVDGLSRKLDQLEKKVTRMTRKK